ncbi:HD-GYP domain-containing protein (c-di-GMP phosphodiesterase class II) [Kushneria sinocarnis]|uniref:HD-GYP domain-containing protein (C-di-GMP phosphodiesterase class II) n=1 Tax=Kushneria sinocarnis TaxID=595502 RepID=A0A420WSJ9_9GAMM|nr:HD domain-containing phosphohydrolase [Kushneria sinocarnis]RKQ95733.1 HD-GYP domain-containing protein (c-di-GMP phosphodiesterase class II) [Kushneria sinocarnis]
MTTQAAISVGQPEMQSRSRQEDAAYVAHVMESIARDTHDVSLTLEMLEDPIPARIKTINTERGIMSLAIADIRDFSDEHVIGSRLMLDAEKPGGPVDSESIHFEDIEPVRVRHLSDSLEIQCSLPRSLFTTSRRGGVRVPFIQGMKAFAEIEVYAGQPTIRAQLRNLSLGGCMLEFPLRECAYFGVNQYLPGITISFPNGDEITFEAKVRHVRPAGRSHHAIIGVSFSEPSTQLTQRLAYFIGEAESELAYRLGMDTRKSHRSALFIEKYAHHTVESDPPKADRSAPMVKAIEEIARQLHITLLHLKNDRTISGNALYDSADTLIHLLDRDRQQALYALNCLKDEPQWLQHALSVAGQLGDIMLSDSGLAFQARDAMVCALLHSMGKPLMLCKQLPSLEAPLTNRQRELLRGHVEVLQTYLEKMEWLNGKISHEVILGANECLDGSGYPFHRQQDELGDLTRITAIINRIDTLRRKRNKRSGMTAFEAYRMVYHQSDKYDRKWVTRYIQRHGFYPIGSLVKFSRGFLAWVMQLDEAGNPVRIRVVKNLAHDSMTLDTILTPVDFSQLGSLESAERPDDYQIAPF